MLRTDVLNSRLTSGVDLGYVTDDTGGRVATPFFCSAIQISSMKKGTKLYSILKFKCPHCHEGQFLKGKHPYHLKHIGDVLEACPICKRTYIKEPGFFYGAMYVAYGLGVATFITVYVAMLILFPDLDISIYFLSVVLALVVTTPYLFAISKSIYANIFYSYAGPSENHSGPSADS